MQRSSSIDKLNIITNGKYYYYDPYGKMNINEYKETAKKIFEANGLQSEWAYIENNLNPPMEKLKNLIKCFGKKTEYHHNIPQVLKKAARQSCFSEVSLLRLDSIKEDIAREKNLYATVSGAELLNNPQHPLNTLKAFEDKLKKAETFLNISKKIYEAERIGNALHWILKT